MKIRVDQIDHEGLHLFYDLDPSQLDLGKQGSLRLEEAAQVTMDLCKLEKGEIYLSGFVSGKIQSECSRCLMKCSCRIEASLHFECRPGPSSFLDGENLLPEEETDLLYYQGDELNIDGEILEQLFLSVPMNPLCHSNCRGLCPGCGKNLNHARCCCQAENTDFCWTDLKNFICKETHAKSKT